MDSLIQQVNTISGLVAEIADPTGKEEIMRKHALSVKAQLQNMTVTGNFPDFPCVFGCVPCSWFCHSYFCLSFFLGVLLRFGVGGCGLVGCKHFLAFLCI